MSVIHVNPLNVFEFEYSMTFRAVLHNTLINSTCSHTRQAILAPSTITDIGSINRNVTTIHPFLPDILIGHLKNPFLEKNCYHIA